MEARSAVELLIDIIERDSDRMGVTIDTTFDSLGIDSLDYLLIIQDVRREIGPVTDAQAYKVTTVGELLKVFQP
jgi:acyl carrier protein